MLVVYLTLDHLVLINFIVWGYNHNYVIILYLNLIDMIKFRDYNIY